LQLGGNVELIPADGFRRAADLEHRLGERGVRHARQLVDFEGLVAPLEPRFLGMEPLVHQGGVALRIEEQRVLVGAPADGISGAASALSAQAWAAVPQPRALLKLDLQKLKETRRGVRRLRRLEAIAVPGKGHAAFRGHSASRAPAITKQVHILHEVRGVGGNALSGHAAGEGANGEPRMSSSRQLKTLDGNI
jgi:hypothetical protein